MYVEVTRAAETDKPVIRRLLELNSYDFSEFDGREIGPHGEYGYPYLDHYWDPAEQRVPFLVTADGRVCGFALVRSGAVHCFGEFFVLRKYRRAGVGRRTALDILSRFPGRWEITQIVTNHGATAFWRTVIPVPFEEHVTTDERTQRFTIDSPQRSGR